ncbi:MAG: thioredoxin domain-containing protein [Candidatus Zixiibacteriota bacterium]
MERKTKIQTASLRALQKPLNAALRHALRLSAVATLLTAGGCSGSDSAGDKMSDRNADNLAATSEQKQVAEQLWYDKNAKLNHLVSESSPYLLSHADNPVDWYPWDDEALARAKSEDRPIFLSVGYASCHWCHVMERESFQDDSVAEFLNANFISIKVDREQRPDLDQIYMTAVQAFTRGGGGWPMSVFLTPDLKPFFAGTYFPRVDSYGRPGFLTLIQNIMKAYLENRAGLNKQAETISRAVIERLQPMASQARFGREIFERAIEESLKRVDFVNGGFGGSTKFPHAAELSALLRSYKLTGADSVKQALEVTLTAMMNRGMYDQVGGGFHRYTVDSRWAVPHFEKMLYDNSLLVPLYLDAYLVFERRDYLDAATATLDFMLREMSDPDGGFYSALDADSDHEEGKFYVWKKSELDSVLGNDAGFYYEYYKVTDAGNFEGNTNVMARRDAAFAALEDDTESESIRSRLKALNQKLYNARAPRIRPFTDDKIVIGWNGMALTAFCRGYQVTGEERFLQAARRLGSFLKGVAFADGKLRHTYRRGVFSEGLFLEDYGYVANGMVDLYETDPDYEWLEFATLLAREGFELFSD